MTAEGGSGKVTVWAAHGQGLRAAGIWGMAPSRRGPMTRIRLGKKVGKDLPAKAQRPWGGN